uniref:Uncharacterized protein n=1 Tax=Oryza rufipogon TaxID=4529 RepID=A0A0E0PUM2_ORYRU
MAECPTSWRPYRNWLLLSCSICSCPQPLVRSPQAARCAHYCSLGSGASFSTGLYSDAPTLPPTPLYSGQRTAVGSAGCHYH